MGAFISYKSPKEVRIKSCTCFLFYRLMQLGIFLVFTVYGFWWEKGSLEFDYPESATTTKLRGVVFTNFSDVYGLNGRIWDAADYVIPPLENGAKFVMTNLVLTPGQRQGVCEEDPHLPDARCENTTCQPGEPVEDGHGVKTGRCVDSTRLPGAKVCEVRAWCPVERDDNTTRTPTPAFLDSKNFTLFIKNNVRFPKFNKQSRNIHSKVTTAEYVSKCRYDPNHAEHCPVFSLNTIVSLAGHSYDEVAEEGGVFQILITWNCKVHDVDDCWPKYSFHRLDRGDHKIFRGFHYRFADHSELADGTIVRTLYKAIGLRLIVTVEGWCSQFDSWKTIKTIGSALGFLTIASIITEQAVYLFGSKFYGEQKYTDYDDVDSPKKLVCCGWRPCAKETPYEDPATDTSCSSECNCICLFWKKVCMIKDLWDETQSNPARSPTAQPAQTSRGRDLSFTNMANREALSASGV